MKLFRRKPRNKASAEAKETKNAQQHREEPENKSVEQASFTSLLEALRGEVIDDGRARETVFYKPGGNVIVATVGNAIHVAFRVSKSNFADRFQWSDEVDADLAAIPTELNGYDLIDLYSNMEDEQTKHTLKNIFRAYSISLLRDLDENFDKVRRVKTQTQVEGEPTELIKNTNVLEDHVETFDLEHLNAEAQSTLTSLALNDVELDQVQLVMKDPGFLPSTAEEKLLFTVASRELTLQDTYESSDLFLWSNILAALQHMFMEHAVTFDYPGRTITDEELYEALTEPAPEVEPEPEVVPEAVPAEQIEYEPILDPILPETEQDHASETVNAPPVSAHMAPAPETPEPSAVPEPAEEQVPEPDPVETPVPDTAESAPTVEDTPGIDLDVAEVFEELDEEEAEVSEDDAVDELSLDDMALPDIDLDVDHESSGATFTPADIHGIMQDKRGDDTEEEPAKENTPLNLPDFPSESSMDFSTPIYDAAFGSQRSTPEQDTDQDSDAAEEQHDANESAFDFSAFDFGDDILNRPEPAVRAPLFERLSKEHGIRLEDRE